MPTFSGDIMDGAWSSSAYTILIYDAARDTGSICAMRSIDESVLLGMSVADLHSYVQAKFPQGGPISIELFGLQLKPTPAIKMRTLLTLLRKHKEGELLLSHEQRIIPLTVSWATEAPASSEKDTEKPGNIIVSPKISNLIDKERNLEERLSKNGIGDALAEEAMKLIFAWDSLDLGDTVDGEALRKIRQEHVKNLLGICERQDMNKDYS